MSAQTRTTAGRTGLHAGRTVIVSGTGEIAEAIAGAFQRHGAMLVTGRAPWPVSADAAVLQPQADLGPASAGRAEVWVDVVRPGAPDGALLGMPPGELEDRVRAAVLSCAMPARAAARLMSGSPGGVVLTVLDTGTGAGTGLALTVAIVEGVIRTLAAELRPRGIRLLGLRIRTGTAAPVGEPDADLVGLLAQASMYGRVCRPDQIGDLAAYLASAPLTGTFHTLVRSPPAT